MEDIDFLKRKATRKDIVTWVALGLTVLGIIVSIALGVIG